MNRKSLFQSKIAKRISKKIIIIYSIIYIILLLSLFLLLTPVLYKNALKREVEMNSILTNEYENLQNQLSHGISGLPDTIYSLLTAYHDNPTQANKAFIIQLLSSYVSSHDNYAAIGIQLPDGEYISSFYYTNIGQEELLKQNVHYQNLLSAHSGSYYSSIYENGIYIDESPYNYAQQDDMIYFSKNMSYRTKTYTITLFYNVSTLLASYNALNDSAFNTYYIRDKYNEIIYSSDETFLQNITENTPSFSSTQGYFSYSYGACFYKQILSTGWIIISYTSYLNMLENLFLVMGLVTALYLISPILYTLFLIPVTRRQLEPLKILSDTMSTFTAGSTVISKITTEDEIEDLSNTFNKMVVEINQQIKSIQLQEHENLVVSYKLLATQIDPHFIYNTMNIINIMARQGNTTAIVEINTALVKILRDRLSTKLTIYDTIQNEYDTLIQYGIIMDYRYKNHVNIHYDIDESLLDLKIPKSILQPLVENCFFHGFGNRNSPMTGNIDILIYSIDDELIIEISDDGNGMTRERLEKLNKQSYNIYDDKKPHIGLNNIRQRLKYIYKEHSQMEIRSVLGSGTTIAITIPKEIPAEYLNNQIC